MSIDAFRQAHNKNGNFFKVAHETQKNKHEAILSIFLLTDGKYLQHISKNIERAPDSLFCGFPGK
jgi:hypothetical protein